jgi:hypothetical protein
MIQDFNNCLTAFPQEISPSGSNPMSLLEQIHTPLAPNCHWHQTMVKATACHKKSMMLQWSRLTSLQEPWI